jgi:hypothetical protein
MQGLKREYVALTFCKSSSYITDSYDLHTPSPYMLDKPGFCCTGVNFYEYDNAKNDFKSDNVCVIIV